MTNTVWKTAEADFSRHFDKYGKGAFVHRLSDTAAAKATSGKRAFVVAQPSDFIVTADGHTFYAEVKSSQDETTFHFDNIRKAQLAASRRVIKANGVYLFFLKSEHLNQWFCVPAHVVHEIMLVKKSARWAELESYLYVI